MEIRPAGQHDQGASVPQAQQVLNTAHKEKKKLQVGQEIKGEVLKITENIKNTGISLRAVFLKTFSNKPVPDENHLSEEHTVQDPHLFIQHIHQMVHHLNLSHT